MPATTEYGLELMVELAIGRASDAGQWGSGLWGRDRWGITDTSLGDWVDVSCDVLNDMRLTASSNTDNGVTRHWESASASLTLCGSQWDPWNGPHRDVIGDRTPLRISWRYPPEPPPVVLARNLDVNPRATTTANWLFSASGGAAVTTALVTGATDGPSVNGQQIPNYIRHTVTVANVGSTPGPYHYANRTGAAGDKATIGTWVRSSTPWNITQAQERFLNGGTPAGGATVPAPGTIPANTWVWIAGNATATDVYTRTQSWLIGSLTVGQVIDQTAGLSTDSFTSIGYFDGATPDTTTRDYAWVGAVNTSASTVSTIQTHLGEWVRAFTGYIATRGYDWDPATQEAKVACVDGTSILVASDRPASPSQGAGETAAERVARLAAAAFWEGSTDVTAGGTTLQATTLDLQSWDELLQVADTDLALLWVKRTGALAYRPRGRVGQGVVLSGRLVVCEETSNDIAVMTMGRNQPSVTRNRVSVGRRADPTITNDAPVITQMEDRQSIARYQAHSYTRTDLWNTSDAWSSIVAQAVLGGGAWPSAAPGIAVLDTATGDIRVGPVLLSLEADMSFDVVDDAGTTYREAVVGWDVHITREDIEGSLQLEDITRWAYVGHWGTAKWGIDRWGIGGI